MSKSLTGLQHPTSFASHHSYPRPSFVSFAFRPVILGSLLLFSFLNLQSCGLDLEDPTAPSPPVWVQKSLPEEWPERGIDAHESMGITLEWEPDPEYDIAAYQIFRAEYYRTLDSLEDYKMISREEVFSSASYRFVDNNVNVGNTYFYKLKAISLSENVSGYSDSLGYRLLQPLSAGMLFPNGIFQNLPANRILSWYPHYLNDIQNYCLTLLNSNEELIQRLILQPTSYLGGGESWRIPDDISLASGTVYKWRLDLAGDYVLGIETSGAESSWAYFYYLDE
jgi:hypothetical protein